MLNIIYNTQSNPSIFAESKGLLLVIKPNYSLIKELSTRLINWLCPSNDMDEIIESTIIDNTRFCSLEKYKRHPQGCIIHAFPSR